MTYLKMGKCHRKIRSTATEATKNFSKDGLITIFGIATTNTSTAWGKLLFGPLFCKLRDAVAGIKINIGKKDVAGAGVIKGHIPHSIHRIRPLRCSHEMKVYTLHEWSQKFQIFFHMGGVPGKIIRR